MKPLSVGLNIKTQLVKTVCGTACSCIYKLKCDDKIMIKFQSTCVNCDEITFYRRAELRK